MQILIPTIGSRDDLQPSITLAQELARSGHTVTLASHPVMKMLVEVHGVTFAPIGPDIDLVEEVANIRLHSQNTLQGLMRSMRFSLDGKVIVMIRSISVWRRRIRAPESRARIALSNVVR